MRKLAGVAALTVGLMAPTAASAQSRQDASMAFTTAKPGVSSGLRVSIDYRDPARPGGKPYAVGKVVETLAEGARFDTSVPARCTASDAQLVLLGAAACPAASRVGTGAIDLDTGAPGPARIVATKVTFFNAADQLIFLNETTSAPAGLRVPVRAAVSGRTVTASVPPLPGVPPPDPFTAIKTVRVALSAVGGGNRAYIRTPAACPATRSWLNTVDFTYGDGVTQRETTASPCRR